jgi:cobalt-zinc-cadmium resistance protein CzcA
LQVSLNRPFLVLSISFGLFIGTYLLFRSLGAVFIPTLEEGDLAMQMTIQPGSSLKESVLTSTKAEKIILENFPEVKHVVSKIGTAEVPTDPMAIEDADIMIILKEKKEWTSASTREELADLMKEKLDVVVGASFEFTQPIQLRFNELMTGAKTDIAVKIFGENTDVLKELADQAAVLIQPVPGAADIKVEMTQGLSQLMIQFDRKRIAQYGLNIEDLNTIVRMAYAGESAGVVFENERKFDLVVRFDESFRGNLDLTHLYTHTEDHKSIPLSEVAQVRYEEGPMQISREDARRYISIGINVRNRDIASLVADIESILDDNLTLPPGYTLKYGGEFENLQAAQKRLSVAVPVALLLIFVLLFFTFEKIKYALMIFTAVPLSAIGGVLALWMRGMPFSISAGVGFIALFGVAVLNGIVLISHFNRLRYEYGYTDMKEVVIQGSLDRMRSVLIAAVVAALGFLPMALSTSNGAEVQKPLATVVIGGLITATLLTLLVMPILYHIINKNVAAPKVLGKSAVIAVLLMVPFVSKSQTPLTLDSTLRNAIQHHPQLKNAALFIQQNQMDIVSSREVHPTEFEATGGQANSKLVDYNFSVNQPLGNAATNKQRKIVAEAKKILSEKEYALIEHNLSTEVTFLWYEWVQWYRKMELLQTQLELYNQLLQKAEAQFGAGEISKVDLTLVQNRLIQTQRALVDAEGSINFAFNLLKKKAYLDGTFIPPDGLIAPLPFPDTSLIVDLFLPPSQAHIQIAQEQIMLQKQMLRPKFSVGYFNQSIRPDYAFQGVTVGMAIPFWKKGNQAQTEKARLELEMAKNQLEQRTFEWKQERQMQIKYTQILLTDLETNGSALLNNSDDIKFLAKTQWENGEIDYFRYLQNMEIALSNEMDHFELLQKYNQAVLHLHYLLGQ